MVTPIGSENEIENEGDDGPRWKDKILLDEKNKLRKIIFFEKLLYQSGSNLKEIVESAFAEMGLEIKKNKKENDKNFEIRLSDNTIGIVEVKATSRKISLNDLNELLKNYIVKKEIEKKKVKGIFVGNYEKDTPPDKRSGKPFTKNVIKLAMDYNFCLLTTTELFYTLAELILLNILESKKEKIERKTELEMALKDTVGEYSLREAIVPYETSPSEISYYP